MLIQKEEFLEFKDFCRNYFKKERQGKSLDVLQGLKECDRKLFKAIEKTVGKRKVKGYIGRLLRSVGREEWLIFEEKVWKAKPKWGYCSYCFSPIDDIYLIDIDNHQFCDSDCFDEYEAVTHYDAYADDYLFLFWDFEKLKGRYRYYLNHSIKKDYKTHLDLTMILRDLYNVLNDSEHSTVLFNGGYDGPVASEMYRMLMILRKDADELEKLLGQCEKVLPGTNERFSIEISEEMMRKRKRPEVLREFIRKNRKYRDKENKNKWFTTDLMQRLNWYDVLKEDEALQNNVSWINEVKCPECHEIVESQWSRRVPDGFFYCETCYEELDQEYDFEEEDLW